MISEQNLAIGRAELITSAARQDATAGFNVSHEPGEIHIGKYIPDSSVGGTLVESTTRTTVSDISYGKLTLTGSQHMNVTCNWLTLVTTSM